jgi:23S rRNA pseudouridine1911/1915/1917 synthase
LRLFPKDRDLSAGTDRVELRVRASDFQARADDLEIRLDVFLARHMPWRSRSSIQALIKDGYLLVDPSTPDHPNGTGTPRTERRSGRKLRHGSQVVIVIPEEYRLEVTPQYRDELEVLYEDDDCVAVDKPPMLAVHPAGRHLTDTIIQRVHRMYGSRQLPREQRPRLCHRLDRETSGVLLIGKHHSAHSELMRQFEEREVEKEYLAILQGAPQLDGGTIDFPLGPARASTIGIKMAPVADGLPSRTDWRVLRRVPGYTLVACRLHTGRQHQIRVHMEAIGYPLVGDKLYGYDEQYFQKAADGTLTDEDLRVLELPRQALHNHRLVFTSPTTGARIAVESPLAQDLATWLEERDGPSAG